MAAQYIYLGKDEQGNDTYRVEGAIPWYDFDCGGRWVDTGIKNRDAAHARAKAYSEKAQGKLCRVTRILNGDKTIDGTYLNGERVR